MTVSASVVPNSVAVTPVSPASISLGFSYPHLDVDADYLSFYGRLNQHDAAVRRIAIMAIADEENSELLPWLHFAVTHDPAPEVRQEAAIRLEGWEDAETLTALSSALLDSTLAVKQAAAQSLSEIKQADSIAPLMPLLAHDDSYVRAATLRAIRELRPLQAFDAIVANIHHADVQVRREAVSTLGWLKQPQAQTLLAQMATTDPDAEVRRIATGALGIESSVSAEVEQALLTALHDEVWQIRVEAALTLGKVNVQSAIAPLIATLDDPYWQVRIPAARSLGKLKATQAVVALATPLQHEISNLRKEAALALSEIGGVNALHLLQHAEHDTDPEVRKAVRIAILQIQQAG